MSKENVNLGDRRDFWNTNFNPITGYRVAPNSHVYTRNGVNYEHKAEYNFR
jgi:hypothetical protein